MTYSKEIVREWLNQVAERAMSTPGVVMSLNVAIQTPWIIQLKFVPGPTFENNRGTSCAMWLRDSIGSIEAPSSGQDCCARITLVCQAWMTLILMILHNSF